MWLKKIFVVLSLVLGCVFLPACSDDTAIRKNAVIFVRQECYACQQMMHYIKTDLQKQHSYLQFEIKDLSIGKNRELLREFVRQFKVSETRVPTPVFFTPKGYTMGWDAGRTPKEMKMLLNIR